MKFDRSRLLVIIFVKLTTKSLNVIIKSIVVKFKNTCDTDRRIKKNHKALFRGQKCQKAKADLEY